MLLSAFLVAGSLFMSVEGKSQDKRLPDGTIVYGDGTRRLPNGTVIYKGGNNPIGRSNGENVILPDGSVVYSDGSRRNPNDRRNGRINRQNLPPGQAKKMYGGNAKDYAKGQQKQWKKDHDDDDHGKGKGKGHKDKD